MNSQPHDPGVNPGEAEPQQPSYDVPPQQPSYDLPPQQPSYDLPPQQPSYDLPPQQPSYDSPPQQPSYDSPPQQHGGQPQQQYGQPAQPQHEQPQPAAPAAKGGWRDKLKAAAETAVDKGKQAASQAKTAAAEQGAKRTQAWAEDPNTLWFGESKDMATSGLGVSKARYRITKDRIQIESGMLGTRSESVPLWSIKDMDVRQAVWQRGKDVGDVVLTLEDPAYSSAQADMFSMSGMNEPGMAATGQTVLDNIEHPHSVVDLLMPLVSEARHKKTVERQSTYMHVNPGMAAMGMPPAAPPPPPVPAAPAPGLAAQLRELAELRDAGVLTQEEFDAQKTRLLNSQG